MAVVVFWELLEQRVPWILEFPWSTVSGRCKERGFVFGVGFRYKFPASKFATQYAVTDVTMGSILFVMTI
jgi:hypothetical protein